MADARGLYRDQILDHYRHPRNRGPLEPDTHRAIGTNPLCGDQISLQLRVNGGERIEAARFDGQGCAISIASASMLTTMLEGQSLEHAKGMRDESFLSAVGVPPDAVRSECALLALQVLRSALGLPGANG